MRPYLLLLAAILPLVAYSNSNTWENAFANLPNNKEGKKHLHADRVPSECLIEGKIHTIKGDLTFFRKAKSNNYSLILKPTGISQVCFYLNDGKNYYVKSKSANMIKIEGITVGEPLEDEKLLFRNATFKGKITNKTIKGFAFPIMQVTAWSK